MTTPLWALLAFTLWTLIVLATGVGIYRWWLILGGKAQLNAFPADEPHGPPFYRRIMRAHANCIENLPVFGALVFIAYATDLRSPMFDALSAAVPCARVVQSLCHMSSGSNLAVGLRFSFFSVQLVAFFAMAGVIVGQALGW